MHLIVFFVRYSRALKHREGTGACPGCATHSGMIYTFQTHRCIRRASLFPVPVRLWTTSGFRCHANSWRLVGCTVIACRTDHLHLRVNLHSAVTNQQGGLGGSDTLRQPFTGGGNMFAKNRGHLTT